MPSNARDRLIRTRFLGATLALLVQAALIAATLLSLTPVFLPRPAPRETTLWLPSLPRPTPKPVLRMIDARGAPQSPVMTAPAAPPPNLSPQAPQTAPGADTSSLQAFGRALFGCAPERYAALSPEERAHCPKPGEGLAYQPPDLLGGPSHVKNNPRWANALAHKQSQLFLPGGLLFPLVAAMAVLDGSITERSSAFRDPGKWPSYVDPGTLMPKDLNDQERNYEAFHKDHTVK
jgi:hypothetical protein